MCFRGSVRQLKEIKGTQIGKEEVKILLFADMIVYRQDPQNSTRECLKLINNHQQSSWIKNYLEETSVALLCTNDNRLKNK
jgi:rRNA-processing protein FCF1